MNLGHKKALASKVLRVGKNRIIFSPEALDQIKEAITKQDIQILHKDGIIRIRPINGRKIVIRIKRKIGPGNIKRNVRDRKQEYVKLTRKLRNYIAFLKGRKVIQQEVYRDLRKKIRARAFKSKNNLKDYLRMIEIDVDNLSPQVKATKVDTKIKKVAPKRKKSKK
ncbi:hypothetical protein J4456_01925 [Candidatus Pacearchaeota archaeon]|nr:hypothetical protein [Candidatus Pacearchaeota archaeon]